jgi:hypothetical protein
MYKHQSINILDKHKDLLNQYIEDEMKKISKAKQRIKQ